MAFPAQTHPHSINTVKRSIDTEGSFQIQVKFIYYCVVYLPARCFFEWISFSSLIAAHVIRARILMRPLRALKLRARPPVPLPRRFQPHQTPSSAALLYLSALLLRFLLHLYISLGIFNFIFLFIFLFLFFLFLFSFFAFVLL